VTLAKAAELDATHLFGFTLGSGANAVGEKEAESEAIGRFGKKGERSATRFGVSGMPAWLGRKRR
jgi:hypothetical protein